MSAEARNTRNTRKDLIKKLFPGEIPKLWCPPLTHYTSSGTIDKKHIKAHLAHMAPHVKTHLIPGSTGDGWELSGSEIQELLEFVISAAAELDIKFLAGILRPDADIALKDITKTIEWLKTITGAGDAEKAMRAAGVCGFNVCAPGGKELSEDFIKSKLRAILDLGYPTALYQIPQFTQNEITPETFADLADRYGNFYMWKDTSGRDAVSLAIADTDSCTNGVFMVRGGEGNYKRWYKAAPGGLYDGFLLGSANCFAAVYSRMIDFSDRGMHDSAGELSDRVTRAVEGALSKASALTFGNPFANSNKAFDQFFAYGPDNALKADAPMTHSGKRLPDRLIRAAKDLLNQEGLMPEKGYLEQ